MLGDATLRWPFYLEQQYGKLVENLENDFLQGRNSYPKTVTAAFNLLINWKQDPRNLLRSVGVSNDGVSFVNVNGGKDVGTEDESGNGHNRNSRKEARKGQDQDHMQTLRKEETLSK